MPTHFCIAIRFLDRAFHGCLDRGHAEWPPSPLRVFQALVATAARRGAGALDQQARSALKWLEGRKVAPVIVAPAGETSSGYRLSVPNNAMDIVAKAWSRGNYSNSGDTDPATHRTMKSVRPTWLLDGDTVYYVWPIAPSVTDGDWKSMSVLSEIARSIVTVGWGIDLAIGSAEDLNDEQVRQLSGERWEPIVAGAELGLRVPGPGTLDALIARHARFLGRLRPDGTFNPPPPLPGSAYRKIEYRRTIDPPRRPIAAFSLLRPDASKYRPFDTVRNGLTLVGMMRHATKCAARRACWPDAKIGTFILGHGEMKDATHCPVGPRRFAYLPLPSIEGRGEGKARIVGSVRRLMLTAFTAGCEEEIEWARRSLSGCDLVNDRVQSVALLSLLPVNEKIVRCYVESAVTWSSVTPVVLPGYDDPQHYRRRLNRGVDADEQKRLLERLNERIDSLLRKAIVQAGFSQELADHAELEWRKVGFWPGTDLADRYGVPDHLRRFPRVHVRLRWRDAQKKPVQVPGPVCLGGGRFYGLGLFAAE